MTDWLDQDPPEDSSLAQAYWCEMNYANVHTASGDRPDCNCPYNMGHNDPVWIQGKYEGKLPLRSPSVADVPPHLRGAVSPERWAKYCATGGPESGPLGEDHEPVEDQSGPKQDSERSHWEYADELGDAEEPRS